ncbi:tyrosine protein kinase transforming protein SEA, putative [Entamoeba histolytica HM-3:IMSS]|uniref:Serine/threonine-protein kinase, putative n=6 Tax=Entamoeba histolytica TaxID=5759 RepID=C4M635_ENTH1|nr:serine/threonine-protein kinase, putative [Entamoeba histolytica HM-1:IMSS]EMD43599.1 tyrosine protein kinase transforming protein, putative [Entamoeba histolytica KU27]EMS17661.1 tyrosine protein kinase transforming protein SEA, putative [Entamoeba histolytica HM-3:IMSS]ENY64728.1 tyrosine protein kinase transforming protein SEA, putative [Entamoeba histolytica HM-1:IMSS-A]GAT96916.1 tyrosin kinase putative [Entamoeba histolytica]EAL50197.1 serine/threonine-protein kinase, putative [Entamo|eukprot:XP_655583.1 serine/threonine-protein kinase, putative [Entamoeba histolytica HM-1:IMSS]
MLLSFVIVFIIKYSNGSYQFNSELEFIFESNQTIPYDTQCPENLKYISTTDCSRSNSFLFNPFYKTIEILNDTICEYVNITLQYGSNLDLYSPPSFLQIKINNNQKQSTLNTQPWGTLGNCVKTLIFTMKGNSVINGLNSIQLIELNNILCIHLFKVTFHFKTTLPEIISLFPSSAPITGGSLIKITTQSNVESSRKFSCYFDIIEVPFQHIDDTHGCCILPNITTLNNWININVILERPGLNLSVTNSFVKFSFYNITLTSAELITFTQSQVILVKGNGFLSTNNAKCKIKKNQEEFIVNALYEEETKLFCDVDNIVSKLFNSTINLGIILNGQDESPQHLSFFIPIEYPSNTSLTHRLIIVVTSTLIIGIFVLVLIFVILCIIKTKKKNISLTEDFINPNEVVCDIILGKGTFGNVWRATWRGQSVAVKLIPTRMVIDNTILQFTKEVQLMKHLRHPCVLQLFGSGTDMNYILIVMELMERGSVRSILADKSIYLTWKRRLKMLHDAASGMYYLHSKIPPIIHRDLKSSNLLVDSLWRVKVSDFGLSISLNNNETIKTTVCGTLSWIAPEILARKPYCQKVDVYSFGIIMWEFLTRDIPYKNIPLKSISDYVVNAHLRPKIPENVDLMYSSLMARCWNEQPSNRPDFKEVVNVLASFITSNQEIALIN